MTPSPEPKRERVVELRRAALVRAGYDEAAADEIAGRLELDLQRALSLVRHGLPPEVARELLLSGDRPVF